jgi:predicted SnoaL-like aldol condensation-catalyzing enzyme
VNQALEDFNTKRALEAYDILFNARDYDMASRYWAPGFVQRARRHPQGRHGLIDFVRQLPSTLRFECQMVVAQDDFVALYGRYSGLGIAQNRVFVDLLRMKDGVVVEQWSVTADEPLSTSSSSAATSSDASPG